jgi:hypothetical protein
LDEFVIARIFEPLEDESSWLRNPALIAEHLKEIAAEMISYATALIVAANVRDLVGNIDVMPSGVDNKTLSELQGLLEERVAAERDRIGARLEIQWVRDFAASTMDGLQKSLTTGDDWRALIPGRPLLRIFCSRVNIDFGRFKNAYLSAADASGRKPFREIEEIFEAFSSYSAAD